MLFWALLISIHPNTMKLIMKTNWFAIFLASALLHSTAVKADDCNNPTAPIIPDGNIASEDELVYAREAVTAYQTRLIEYRQCLQTEDQNLQSEPQTQSEETLAKIDQSIDDETIVVEKLNQAIRTFKDRG